MDTATQELLVPPPSNQAILNELKATTGLLREIRNQLSQEAPLQDVFPLNILTTVRIFAARLVILPLATATISLMVSSQRAVTLRTPSAGVVDLPFPITIEQGTQAYLINEATGATLTYGPAATPVLCAFVVGLADNPRGR